MNRIDLDNFYSDTFQLTRTMVVKIEAIAQRENEVLEKAGYTVLNDKRTWRYYMNLNGDYHETDEVMTVISLDTGEEIPFTKETMAQHLLTYRQYLKGGDLYKRLTDTYDGQTVLINGILLPITYDVSIDAPNYKILRYNESLVLWNEEQLIPQVQRWINGNAPAMFENEYHVTEDLMLHQMVVELGAAILQVIHLTRFQAIKTRNAHDFYIWSHIDSYGEFSVYKNSLNREQVMWLHRNIEWINSNAGKEFTFDKLMEKLLTLRKIPISKYEMVLNTENQLVDLTPTPQWKRTQLNMNEDKQILPVFFNTQKLIEKERPMAVDNTLMTSIYQEEANFEGTYSLHNDLPTKVLESEMADYTNRHSDTMMTVVFNQWIYLAGKGVYQVNMAVVNPKDGRLLRLDAKDAFTLWRYITRLAAGHELTTIENAFYNNVMALKPPTVKELQNVGLGSKYITDAVAGSIRDQFVDIVSVGSSEELLNVSKNIYIAMWKHKKLYSSFGDHVTHAAVKNSTKLMYETGEISLVDDHSYLRFLQKYALDFDDYNYEELTNLAWVIFKTFTGWDLNNNPSLRSIQNDLIDLMMKLSSYTVHTIKTMDDGTDVIELPYDNSLGDSQYLGLGHQLEADFSNVHLKLNHALALDAVPELEVRLPDTNHPKLDSASATVKARFVDTTRMRLDHSKDITPLNALRFPNSNFFTVETGSTPHPDFILPPTYYGELEEQDEPEDLIIPPTFYGELGEPVEPEWLLLDPTYYGLLGTESK